MKKAIALLSVCALLTACGASPEPEQTAAVTDAVAVNGEADVTPEEPAVNANPDFRNVSWGMSVEDVKKYEDAELSSENNDESRGLQSLIYDDISVINHPARLIYSFENGKLSFASYSLNVTESKDYLINNAFFDIADGISAKYGEPQKETFLIYCGKELYSERTLFFEPDNFSFDTTEYSNETGLPASPLYMMSWTNGNTEISLDMYVSKNDDGIFTAPDTYDITYSAIDVDNAL